MGFFSRSALEGSAKSEKEEGPDPFETLLSQPALPRPASTGLAQGMTLTGTLHGEGEIVIEGKLVGEIETSGTVTVATSGEVEGPIVVENAKIAGFVKGNITARTQLRLEPTGRVEGDISAASLIVENGGSFNGCSSMLQPVAQTAAPEPKAGKDAGGDQDKY